MNASDIDAILAATLEDRTLTRTERQALQAVLDDRKAGETVLALFRSRAFELARDAVSDPRAREVIGWLEDTVKALQPSREPRETSRVEAWFSPGEAPLRAIMRLIGEARGSVDWTRSAADENHENVLVSDDPRLVLPFCRAFDDLWTALG